jgi:hypothetical protein
MPGLAVDRRDNGTDHSAPGCVGTLTRRHAKIAMTITNAVASKNVYVLAPAGQPRLIRAPDTTTIMTATAVMNHAKERAGT